MIQGFWVDILEVKISSIFFWMLINCSWLDILSIVVHHKLILVAFLFFQRSAFLRKLEKPTSDDN